jgi:hypothetical protein
MAIAQRLVVAGMSAVQAQAALGTVANNLTAVVGGQNAAGSILGSDINRFTTVAAGGACTIPPLNPADYLEIYNFGANPLALYPPTGGQINALGTNAAYSILTTTPYATVTCVTPTQYHAFQSS